MSRQRLHDQIVPPYGQVLSHLDLRDALEKNGGETSTDLARIALTTFGTLFMRAPEAVIFLCKNCQLTKGRCLCPSRRYRLPTGITYYNKPALWVVVRASLLATKPQHLHAIGPTPRARILAWVEYLKKEGGR